jgi:hypothetical protein
MKDNIGNNVNFLQQLAFGFWHFPQEKIDIQSGEMRQKVADCKPQLITH